VLRADKNAILEEGELDAEAKKQLKKISEEIWELDPTMPMRTKIAMGVSKIEKAWGLDSEEGIYHFEDMMEENEYGEMNHIIFDRLAELTQDPDPEVKFGAFMILKGINERNAFIREALGKDFVTVEGLAADKGLAPWQFKRGNIMFRARTITEQDMARFAEKLFAESGQDLSGNLLIPEEMLKSALVLGGKRKQFFIPEELADQLDDLPVMHRDDLDVVLRKPFLMWKGWILRINSIRYNLRNALGDSEGAFAARGVAPFKLVPKSIKLMIQKKGPDYWPDAWEYARETGVIGSSMQYEFGNLRSLEEFRMFEDVTDKDSVLGAVKAFEQIGRRVLQKPQEWTQFREDILRMAVMLDAYKRVKDGDYSHLAGRLGGHKDVKHLVDEHGKEGIISRETLGDYGAFTPWENKALRQNLMLFYSWLKINTLRWPRIVGNSFKESRDFGKGAGRAGIAVGSKLLRVMLPYLAIIMWNNRDDEARKREKAVIANQPWLSGFPHITLDDGSVIYTPSALSEFIEWFDLEDSVALMHKFERGEVNFGQLAWGITRENAKEIINKPYKALNPFLKAALRVGGLETFPDVFEPRYTYDAFKSSALRDAFLDVLGPEAKRAYKVTKGKLTVQEALSYYFSGSSYRPMTPEKLTERLLLSFAWTALKTPSKTTKRKTFEAKKGREEEWRRAKEGLEALGYTESEIRSKLREIWREQRMEKRNVEREK
jgi:hypothetical protein